MIAVTSPGFVLFAALLAGLWYVCPPPRRWALAAGGQTYYFTRCSARQHCPVLAGSSFLVWWCGRRTAKKPVFLAGLAAALLPLALLQVSARCAGLAGHAGERSGHRLFYAAARQLSV